MLISSCDTMATRQKWILWVILVSALASCGGDGGADTCIAVTVSYAGAKSGPAYYVVRFGDGGHYAVDAPSIQVMMTLNGFAHCVQRLPGDIPFTAIGWIDVAGTTNCSDTASPLCQPSPTDPQAQQSGVERFGQTTQVRLDLVDPP